MDEAIGRVDLLGAEAAIEHWKARGVDLTHILAHIELPDGAPRHRVEVAAGGARGRAGLGARGARAAVIEAPVPAPDGHADGEAQDVAVQAIARDGSRRARVEIELPIRNVNRCVGGILSSHIARARGAEGLPPDSIVVDFKGSAGQSFGGWLAPGVTFSCEGDTNDYTGKGLSGGVRRRCARRATWASTSSPRRT